MTVSFAEEDETENRTSDAIVRIDDQWSTIESA